MIIIAEVCKHYYRTFVWSLWLVSNEPVSLCTDYRYHCPYDYDEDEETENMERHSHPLEERKLPNEEGIKHDSNQRERNRQECIVPAVINIVLMADRDKSKDLLCSNI